MKIIGMRSSSFKGDNGVDVSGVSIYLTYPLEKGEGLGSERVYLTEDKLSKMTYNPRVGDEVQVMYNRYGKCDCLVKAH